MCLSLSLKRRVRITFILRGLVLFDCASIPPVSNEGKWADLQFIGYPVAIGVDNPLLVVSFFGGAWQLGERLLCRPVECPCPLGSVPSKFQGISPALVVPPCRGRG